MVSTGVPPVCGVESGAADGVGVGVGSGVEENGSVGCIVRLYHKLDLR